MVYMNTIEGPSATKTTVSSFENLSSWEQLWQSQDEVEYSVWLLNLLKASSSPKIDICCQQFAIRLS